jgi:anaerobic magnesium-protoporphyrin IX monomethyl ester cyclase
MLHVCLINPPGVKTISGIQGNNPNPPIGLAYIAAAIREAGHRVTLIDATGEAMDQIKPMKTRPDILVQGLTPDQIIDRVPADVDVVGIGCSFSSLWLACRDILERVRDSHPDIPLIMGGEHASALPEHVLQTSRADICVIGEGEETIVELLEAITQKQDLHGVAGIAFREGDQIFHTPRRKRMTHIDDLPLPAWDLFPMEEYRNRKQNSGLYQGRAMPLLATRGCPYRCTFCSSPNMWTTRYVTRDPVKVVDEMQLYMSRYGATDFHLQDLTAIVNKRWIIRFCDEILNRKLNIVWQLPSGTRCEAIDEEVCEKLAATGCKNLSFAPESGSPRILKAMRKQVDLDRMIRVIKTAWGHRLGVDCFVLVGMPQETRETLRETLHFVRRLAWIGAQDVGISMFVPYPGSELFRELLAANKIRMDDTYFISAVDYAVDEDKRLGYAETLTTQELYRWLVWLFLNFYILSFIFHPVRTARTLGRFLLTGREESRYAKWFRDRLKTRRRWRRSMARQNPQPTLSPCNHSGPEFLEPGAEAGALTS